MTVNVLIDSKEKTYQLPTCAFFSVSIISLLASAVVGSMVISARCIDVTRLC